LWQQRANDLFEFVGLRAGKSIQQNNILVLYIAELAKTLFERSRQPTDQIGVELYTLPIRHTLPCG
jgi:hypothetical protein